MSESNNSYYQLPGSIVLHHNSPMQPILNESSSNVISENNVEYPVLLLTQQPDSHHFNERRIVLNDTIKVGRSVARARPSDMNAIFDCKVLSRNHAIFWYDNGKVWLKDTKSSNGTFVNSQLLSKGTEDSPPREIYSGDIIQFGVEVIENTTTHGCIIAQVSIFMSDGSEIRRHPDMAGLTSGNIPISNYYEEQIYQLAQYIQEAAHREQTLEKKLNSLSQLIIDTQEASDSSWKVILNQDRLMEKLEMLQEQVEVHLKGDEQDSLANELRRVLEQRYGLERESKNLLERLIQEKTEVLQRVVDLERSLVSSEEECSQLRSAFELLQHEHGKITSKVVAGKDEVDQLQKRLQEAQSEYSTEMRILSADKESLLNRYSQLCDEADQLRSKLENMELGTQEGQLDVQEEPEEADKIKKDLVRTETEIYKYRDKLQESSDRQSEMSTSVKCLQSQLTKALITEITNLQNLNCLEISMENSESNLDTFLLGTTSDLALHFIQSLRHIREGLEMTDFLKDEVSRLQQSLSQDKSLESSFTEMDGLLGKITANQHKTKSMLTEIPEKLMHSVVQHVHKKFADQSCQISSESNESREYAALDEFDKFLESQDDQQRNISPSFICQISQTDSVSLVHSQVQFGTDLNHQSIQVQTVNPYPLIDQDAFSTLQIELKHCLGQLDAEKKVSSSLRMELVQLQNDKQDLMNQSNMVTEELNELKKFLEDAKSDMDIKKETVQRVSASEYGQLYQESQKLRAQVQEIEEEMIAKRKDYDLLFEQYEALLSGEKVQQVTIKPVTDRIEELEQLCTKQRCEIEELKENMNEQYQSILTRSRRVNKYPAQASTFLSDLRRVPETGESSVSVSPDGLLHAPLLIRSISAISSVPLCVLTLAIIIFILSFLARPWIPIDSSQ